MYSKTTPGVCFCCYSKGQWNNKWKDWSKFQKLDSKLRNCTQCTQKTWLWGSYNSSYQSNRTKPWNETTLMVYYKYILHNPIWDYYFGFDGICSGWMIKDPNLWFFYDKWATNFHSGVGGHCIVLGYLTMTIQVITLLTTSCQRYRDADTITTTVAPQYLGPGCNNTIVLYKCFQRGLKAFSMGVYLVFCL